MFPGEEEWSEGFQGFIFYYFCRLNLPTIEVAREVKPVSVGDAFMSDSEEEEIISGIFGKKTLIPWEKKQKTKTKINKRIP